MTRSIKFATLRKISQPKQVLMQTTHTGLDVLENEEFALLKGARVGVLMNASAVTTARLELLHEAIVRSNVCTVKKIFSPEHGLFAVAQDMVAVDSVSCPQTGLPIISLYGEKTESLYPKESDLKDIDILVVDLPDVGSRYYTYAQTMAYAMEVCGRVGVKVIVLDRPNPIGGAQIEGAPLLKSCRSFCGYTPVANRHGLTLGELAFLYRDGFGEGEDQLAPISCELEVIKTKGWKRSQYFDQTDLKWVIPSPNMPTLDTAIVYPGGCLFEATNISEGRGTTRPFEYVGAPGINNRAWIEQTLRENIKLEGFLLRPISFMPQFQKHAGKNCSGVQVHVTDRKTFSSFKLYLALISALKKIHPEIFAWRKGSYEFINNVPAIDLLYGSALFRESVDGSGDLSKVATEVEMFEESYRKEISERLSYLPT
jgi:uncharacterized protein YbbC (DUF1343 family)